MRRKEAVTDAPERAQGPSGEPVSSRAQGRPMFRLSPHWTKPQEGNGGIEWWGWVDDRKAGGRARRRGDRSQRLCAYLRWGLGEVSPRGGSAGWFGLMVDSDLRGGSRGTIWRRRRALVLFYRGVVTVEARQEGAR